MVVTNIVTVKVFKDLYKVKIVSFLTYQFDLKKAALELYKSCIIVFLAQQMRP